MRLDRKDGDHEVIAEPAVAQEDVNGSA